MIVHPRSGVAALLALGVLVAPLPFGSISPRPEALLQVLAFLSLGAAAVTLRRPGELTPVALPALSLASVGLLGALQAVRWPVSLVAALSPLHLELHRGAAAVLPEGHAAARPALSLAPDLSLDAALAWSAAAAVLVAAALVGRRRHRRRLLAASIVLAALFQLLYGARRWVVGLRTIWGREVPGAGERLRGTFVNPNHLAFLLEIALVVVFAWGWWALRRARHHRSLESRVLLVVPPVVVWAGLFLGLSFTGSRGGLAGAVVGTVVGGLVLAFIERRWHWAPVGLVAAFAGLALVAAVSLREGLGRWLATPESGVGWPARLRVYELTVELWLRSPWTGTGLGTFREALPLVQPEEVPGNWIHAHSDPLELLATAGLVGGLLVGVGLVAVLLRLGRVLAAGRRSEDRAAALAALAALAAMGLHESVDFGLTLPANAFALAVVVGAALGASVDEASSGRRDRAGPDPPRQSLDGEQVEAR